MVELIKITPIVLYFIIGILSLIMAFKNLFSNKYLPFHEQAADKKWNEIENPLKLVILSLMRIIGLGFLIISLLLIVYPIVNYFTPNIFYKYGIPLIALFYCTGLFIINYLLYRKTNADTPWKKSIYAMVILIIGIIISMFN